MSYRPEPAKKYKLPMRAMTARYSVSSKTIERWTDSGLLPRPLVINKLRYWDLAEIEAMESARMAAQSSNKDVA